MSLDAAKALLQHVDQLPRRSTEEVYLEILEGKGRPPYPYYEDQVFPHPWICERCSALYADWRVTACPACGYRVVKVGWCFAWLRGLNGI